MRAPFTILSLLLSCFLSAQDQSFDSFISRLSKEYNVDVAIAPELMPVLDSIKSHGNGINSIQELLETILRDRYVSYQIIDGNKVLLRREHHAGVVGEQILISGTILDKLTLEPLAFAAVSILNTTRGTYTDEHGNFNLYVDKNADALQISYLGYKSVVIPIHDFNGNTKSVELETDNFNLDQVMIIVPFYQVSNVSESQSVDLKGYQFVSESDVMRWGSDKLMNQLTGYTHFSSEEGFRIRSSEDENSLVILDDIPVYDPYHFYNIFSPFNGHYFESVTLFKNNMPVEYGGRIDGMIKAASTQNENNSKLIFDTDLLLTAISTDICINDNLLFKAGGRFSHTQLLNEALGGSETTLRGNFRGENEWTSSQEPTFNFYDINLGINFISGKHSEFNLAFFKNKDYVDNRILSDFSISSFGQEVISIEQLITSKDDWNNQGLAAGFQTKLNDHINLNINGYISSFEKNIVYHAVSEEDFPDMNKDRSTVNAGFQNSTLQSGGLKAFIENNEYSKSQYKIGLDLQQHQIDLIAKENTTTYLLEVQKENEATLFGEYLMSVTENLDLALGGRISYLQSTSDFYPQPNLRLNYFINDEWLLKSSFSKNIQAIRELSVENRFGREVDFLALSLPDAGYPVLKSDKYMVGSTYSSKFFTFDGELYYKKTDGLVTVRAPRPDPSFRDQTSAGDFYRLFMGEGWTAGFDLITTYKTNKSETSLSYTLSKISNRFDELFNGNDFSPKEDRRHQVKLASHYRVGPFIASGLASYKSEAYYISFARLESQGSLDIANHARSLRELPAYFSVDLALDYNFRIATHTSQVGISLLNATDHVNISDLQHIGRISRESGMNGFFMTHRTKLLGRTLNIHFRLLLD